MIWTSKRFLRARLFEANFWAPMTTHIYMGFYLTCSRSQNNDWLSIKLKSKIITSNGNLLHMPSKQPMFQEYIAYLCSIDINVFIKRLSKRESLFLFSDKLFYIIWLVERHCFQLVYFICDYWQFWTSVQYCQ